MNTHELSGEAAQAKADLLGSSLDAAVPSNSGSKQAETFVQEKGPYFHTAFSIETQFDLQRVQVKQDPFRLRDPLRTHTDHFYRVIEIYRQRVARNNVLPPDFDIRGKHTWDEVFQAARDASRHSSDTQGIRGLAKRFGRTSRDAVPYVQPMLQIIPNGDYTGALCGGLKIAFGIAIHRKEKREAIVEAFNKIPEAIEKAEHCRERYPEDTQLYDFASELYLAILDAITGMIKWLVGESFWKKNWAALSHSLTEKPIDIGLQGVQDWTSRLLYRAEKLQDDANVETNTVVKETQTDMKQTTTVIQQTQTTVNATNISAQRVDKTTTEIDWKLSKMLTIAEQERQASAVCASKSMKGVVQDQLRSALWKTRRQKLKKEEQMFSEQIERTRAKEQRLREDNERIHNKELQLYEKEAHIKQTEADFYKQQVQIRTLQQASQHPLLRQEQLAALLTARPETNVRDLERVIAQGTNGPQSLHTQGHWLLRNKKFQTWLNSETTRGLFVNDNLQSTKQPSSMQFACVTLIQGLIESQDATTLSFFCSLHAYGRTTTEGPQGLIQSLISQLLPLHRFDVGFIDEAYLDNLRRFRTDYFCDLFTRLVKQMPNHTVLFCIIDSISVFDVSKYGSDMSLITEALSKLTQALASTPGAPMFKVLMTTSKSSKRIRNSFLPEDSIAVPPQAEDGREVSGSYILRHAQQIIKSPVKGSQPNPRQEPIGSEDPVTEPLDLLGDVQSDSEDGEP